MDFQVLGEENVIDSDIESSSEDSESDDESDDEIALIALIATGRERRENGWLIPRVQGYVENVVSRFNGEEFRQTFRIRPRKFEYILQFVAPLIVANNEEGGRETTRPETQLLICLYYFATPVAYRCIADLFGVAKSTAWKAVNRCVVALYSYKSNFIRWPTQQEANATAEFFEAKTRFPGIIGIVDGSHVRIQRPKKDAEAYFNRKKFCSIQFQVVCNQKLEFFHVYAGFPGSVHDARVFNYSGVQSMCLNNEDQLFPEDSHLLADSAYTNQKRLIVPFKDHGNLTVEEKYYNKVLSSNRIHVECAIGLLKIKWRRLLDMCSMTSVELIPYYIVACTILHNIDLKPIEQLYNPGLIQDNFLPNEGPALPNQLSKNLGTVKRDRIKDLLNM